jgi:hypothetical protein
VLRELHQLWKDREKKDEYFGTLVNAYLERGGKALAVRAGESYVDIGTLHGYRSAMNLLSSISKDGTVGPDADGSRRADDGADWWPGASKRTQPILAEKRAA